MGESYTLTMEIEPSSDFADRMIATCSLAERPPVTVQVTAGSSEDAMLARAMAIGEVGATVHGEPGWTVTDSCMVGDGPLREYTLTPPVGS